MMHAVVFLAKRIQNQISHIDWRIDSVDVRWCMLWFSGQENTKTAIAHRLVSTRSMCDDACCCDFLGQENTKAAIAHRLVSTRSMCDDACCDFLGQENTKTDIAHRLVSTRSMCDDACCDFLAKRIQKQISHIDWCLLGRCAMMMRVVIFMLSKRRFYAPQTKILDGWTKHCVCVFERVFNKW